MPTSYLTETDARLLRELQPFLPSRCFDAHAHLYRAADLTMTSGHFLNTWQAEVTEPLWRFCLTEQLGDRHLHGGLFFPVPFVPVTELPPVNAALLSQIASLPDSRMLALVAPQASPDDYVSFLPNPHFAGFKPYHTYSTATPTFESALDSFLPEWAWEMADAHKLLITIHLVRDLALADPGNQRSLRAHCERFPNARVILAHAARGFHAPNTVHGLPSLARLDNVWFDSSGVCESTALVAILEAFGPRKLLWSSDFPVSQIRGKCITVGDGFLWVDETTVDWTTLSPACRPALVGIESLRALRDACATIGLMPEDVQDIFADNARRLLGLQQDTEQTQSLYLHAKTRIPGGTQLLSKRPEMLAPDQWPAYFREARGCETWDLDGRRYTDMSSNGIGACLLGFRDPDVTAAVRRRVTLGSMSTLNPPEEVAVADLLCEMHPWAEQARFARCGGETCAMAIRIARATTDRSVVAICGYHGWQDWYLAANLGDDDALRGHLLPGLEPLGVPRELRGTAITFPYGDIDAFQAILDQHGDRLAAVIMEPCRYHDPAPCYLETISDGAHQRGALLVFDEITIGWRLCMGGSHRKFSISPDIAVFAKALGNGHPMGAVIGTTAAMVGAHDSFISSTYWTESVGPAAALATIRKMQAIDVPTHVAKIGALVKQAWREAGARHGLPVVSDDGYPCLAHFRFDHPQTEALRTLYTQLMLGHGFLAGTSIYPTLAHTEVIVARYADAVDAVFAEIAVAISDDSIQARLNGPVAHSGFRRLL